jgi:integrase/recombinase XerD
MFEKLFKEKVVVNRHEHAPYREERERYLAYCMAQGYTRSTLGLIARELLWVAQKLSIDREHGVTLKKVRAVARGWEERERRCGHLLNTRWTCVRFIQVARSWLRFLGHWSEPRRMSPFEHLVEDYRLWMKDERGFTPATVERKCGHIRQFLLWYGDRSPSFSKITLEDIDAFLSHYGSQGVCRTSVKNMAIAIKAFLTYAGSKDWCSASIAGMMQSPRIWAQEQLPRGPSWEDVKRLIASMETDHPCDIRDRALVLLFVIYGFRATEVATLKLESIDWEQSLISVSGVKRGGRRTYPLIPTVGNAIIRYLREARPQSSLRELFLTLIRPVRPLTRFALHHVTCKRMRTLGIHTPHVGPHALRHACATHLVTEGLSLKEIGDHLGHRSSSATRIYAKVDLPRLREVAAFDLGGLS